MIKEELRDILLDSYGLILEGFAEEVKYNKRLKKDAPWVLIKKPKKEGGKEYDKYEIENRTKIKSMIEGLRQFDDPDMAVLHFVKYAEYFLPRSDFYKTLDVLLTMVNKAKQRGEAWIRHKTNGIDENDPAKHDKTEYIIKEGSCRIREQIQYLIGYTCWSMDALCEIFTECDKSGKDVEEHVRKMVETEFNVIGASDRVGATVKKIMNWYASAQSGRR